MASIVTTHYRYKRPPAKRKPATLEVPAIVRKGEQRSHAATSDPAIVTPGKGRAGNDNRAEAGDLSQRYDNPAEAGGKSADAGIIPSRIVTVRRRGKRFADVPDMTPEEHQARGDAAVALWREMVRRVAGDG